MITQSDKDDIKPVIDNFWLRNRFSRRSQREMVAEVARVFARTEEAAAVD